jgi:hypothetical protein
MIELFLELLMRLLAQRTTFATVGDELLLLMPTEQGVFHR